MELSCEDTEFVGDLVSTQYFDWHQQWVSHQVRVHHAVKDMDTAIIGRTRHERIPGVVPDGADRTLVVFECFVGRGSEVQIEPDHAAIKTANNEVIA
mmetsp:Transcript_11077/g.15833  ORF Transcript_11077/g.15833 Transcript_11077/m.15833 type:complete len:97 (-) Transcript_11077:445-735(-)